MKNTRLIIIAIIGLFISFGTTSCTKEIIKQETVRETRTDSIIYRNSTLLSVENERNNSVIVNTRNTWLNAGVDVIVPETGKYFVYVTTPINYLTGSDWATGRVFNITSNKELNGFEIGTGPLDVAGSSNFVVNLNKSDVLTSEVKVFHQTNATSNFSIGHPLTHVVLGIIKID